MENNPLNGGTVKPQGSGFWGKFITKLGNSVEAVGDTITELFTKAADKATNTDNGNTNQ